MADSALEFICARGVSAATPLMLAGIGELVAERAGVINIGIEGLMLAGSLAAYAGCAHGGGVEGIALAALVGVFLAALFAGVAIWSRADQIVAGTAINLVAAGGIGVAWDLLSKRYPQLPAGAGFDDISIPGLSSIPFFGPIFFRQFLLTYLLAALALAAWAILRYTRAGLIVRALGDAPDACAAAGVRVRLWRTCAVLFAGATAGIAGAYLSIMRTHTFTTGGVGGRGFLVLALVIFGRWNIAGLAAGCFLFGTLDVLQQYIQAASHPAWIPLEAFPMLPYLVTLAALAILSRRNTGPAYLGKPFPER